MASASTSEHGRGAASAAPRLIRARIAEIRRETPRVSVFWLEYGEQPYRFRPGQWIDLYATLEGRREVGGYSITSTPNTPGRIRIAVRHSDRHPVTRWLSRFAEVGDEVEVSEGQGDFHYDSAHGDRLILLAAGIGITPILGILREIYESRPKASATLFYSARSADELLFRAELDAMASSNPNVHCLYTVTGEGPAGQGRVLDLLDREGPADTQATYYFCGPKSFVDDLVRGLPARGVAEERLVYERWW
ncbi:ferredoxin--NADP reductase [Acidihalobacter prosperus]